jgi:HSP20 family protein
LAPQEGVHESYKLTREWIEKEGGMKGNGRKRNIEQLEKKEGGSSMALTKLAKRENPLITPWHRLMDDIFDMRPFFDWRPEWEMTGFGSGWSPALDIAETSDEYLMRAELPGVKKEDVKISLAQNVLTITGEKKTEYKEENKKYHRLERSYGTFQRSFTLPSPVKADDVSASFKEGILEIRVPKTEEAKAKVIDIKVD